MPFYPAVASGLVLLESESDGQASIGGTCASYVNRHTALTAAHCVPTGTRVAVLMTAEPSRRELLAVSRHPTADLAILHMEPRQEEGLTNQVFQEIPEDLVDAGDFLGYGFVAEEGAEVLPVTPRTFKGHFQRYMEYSPPTGGPGYFAGEMSIPAPAGFSGGVLSYVREPQRAVAVVTANHDSYVTLDRFEEVDRDGRVYRERVSRVVSYGIAAMLSGHRDWLAAEIASHTDG